MDSIFLANRDLRLYTRPAKTKADQVQILIEKGIPFDINGAGDILVLKSSIEAKLGTGEIRAKKIINNHQFGSL